MSKRDWYVPTTEEIKASATRLGGWRPEAFDLWLELHDLEVVENERETLAMLIERLPVKHHESWYVGHDWDTVLLGDVLRTVRGEG